jgi:hypothetical protein
MAPALSHGAFPPVNCAGAVRAVPAAFCRKDKPRDPNDSAAIRQGGEAGLVAAIIEQAWLDAQRPLTQRGKQQPARVTPEGRAEARALLTREAGEWRDSREALCGAIGIDPEALRQAAVKMLARLA